MIIIVTASADTYITNKLVDGTQKVSGNVGAAGTIDIFKLYDESYQVTGAIELSRGLIAFDYGRLRELTSSILDLNNFQATLRLKSVNSGQPTPHDFTLSLFPLSSSFREGLGRDVASFSTVDAANFLSKSAGNLWNLSGANAGGLLGSGDIDYITSGNLQDGLGVRSLEIQQYFDAGNEDLVVDVTDFVSASMVGILPQAALRVSFTGSQEIDEVTRFVKRFAARNAKEVLSRPKLVISFDDSIVDNRDAMFFDVSGTLHVSNLIRGVRSNFVSGSSLSQLTGEDCVMLKLSTGSFTASFTGSQAVAVSGITGLYQASCIILSNDTGIVTGSTTIADCIRTSGSITFDEKWTTIDGSVTLWESQLTIANQSPIGNLYGNEKLVIHCDGPSTAPGSEIVMIRARPYDLSLEDRSAKFAYARKPVIVSDMMYRIVDLNGGEVIVDYDKVGTRASVDVNGGFFKIPADIIPPGRPVTFEFLVTYNGTQRQLTAGGFTFTRES